MARFSTHTHSCCCFDVHSHADRFRHQFSAGDRAGRSAVSLQEEAHRARDRHQHIVVHVRALSNLAWLKKPSLNKDFKVLELVALCTAALRPSTATWERFIRHLTNLQKSQRLNSDEVTSILISSMSDQLLTDAEIIEEDPSDIDAATLDEVVDRVTASYSAKAEAEHQKLVGDYEGKIADLKERESSAVSKAEQAGRTLAEERRRRALWIEGRARGWA